MKKFILLLLLLFSFTYLFASKIYVVKSSSIALYDEAILGFRETMAMSGQDISIEILDMMGDEAVASDIIQNLKSKRDITAIFTLGARASEMVSEEFTDVPVIFAYVLNWKSYPSLHNENVTGIEFEIAPNVSLALFSMVAPTAKRMGLIYDPENSSEVVETIEEMASVAGFELITAKVSRSRDVSGRRGAYNRLLEQDIEALWMIADPTVLTRRNLRYLIEESNNNNIPTLTVQDFFVESGALFAIVPDYGTIGSQAFNIAQNIINGQHPRDIPVEAPMGSNNIINNATAEKLGLTFDDFLTRMFNESYETITEISIAGAELVGTDRYAAEESFFAMQEITVVTASRTAQSITQAPATMMVITQEQIENRGYKDLKDVFRDLPGFDISENNQGEVRTLPIARGILGNNKLMILLDGEKINSPGGELFVYGNNVPLFNVKAIEIMYGPSAAMYGADAYSGVINMITKDVDDIDGKGEINVSYGSYNTLDISGIVGNRISDNLSYIFSFRKFTSDGIDVFDNFTAEELFKTPGDYVAGNPQGWEQPIRNFNIYSKIDFNNLTIGIYRQDAEEPGGPGTDATWNPNDSTSYVFSEDYIWHQILNKIYLKHTFDEENYAVTTTLSYSDYEVDNLSNFNYTFGPQYKYAKTTSTKFEQVYNNYFTENFQLTSGIMFEQVTCFPKTNNLATPFSGNQLIDYVDYPDTDIIPDEYRNQIVYFGAFDYQNFGIFSELTYRIQPNLQLNVGLRFDYNTDYKENFSPRAGIVYDYDDYTNIKLLYGQAYIAPSKYKAYEHWSAGAFGFRPNPDLKPEQLTSISFNVRRILNPNFTLTLNTFYNQMKDLHTTVGYPWMYNINAGEPESKGFELLLDYGSRNMNAFLYYSYLDAETDDGSKMNKVADNKINAGLTYYYNNFSFSPSLRWTSNLTKLDSDKDPSTSIDGSLVIDFSARARDLIENVDAFLNIRNLLNEKYYAASPYSEGQDGWLMDKTPQPGMIADVGFTYKF